MPKYFNTFVKPSQIKTILDEDADVYTSEGKLLLRFRKKKLSKDKSFKLEKISADLGEFSDHLYQRYIRQIFLLISHRFVGFDAVLAVTIYDNKGFDLFFSSFFSVNLLHLRFKHS